MNRHLIYGSWKLRHNEPLGDYDRHLALVPLPEHADVQQTCTLPAIDLSPLPNGAVGIMPSGEEFDELSLPPGIDWEGWVPLGLVEGDRTGSTLTHVLYRYELDTIQLIRLPQSVPLNERQNWWQVIWNVSERNHLYFSNYESYYRQAQHTIELEQKLDLTGCNSYMATSLAIYTALRRGQMKGFAPKLGREVQMWSYDNDFYEILPPTEADDHGYLSIIHYCLSKSKRNWNDPLFMFKKKIFRLDSLERWERNDRGRWLEPGADRQQRIEEFYNYRTRALPSWRRSRVDVVTESLATGNIFMINTDDCRIDDPRFDSFDTRLRQCEIEYCATQGEPVWEKIHDDLDKLSTEVTTWLAKLGIEAKRSAYSKLTWLRNVCREEVS